MGIGTLGDIHQLGDDVRRRGAIGIAHAHVDDVLAAPARGELELRGDIEYVRRKPIDARKAALACRRIRH